MSLERRYSLSSSATGLIMGHGIQSNSRLCVVPPGMCIRPTCRNGNSVERTQYDAKNMRNRFQRNYEMSEGYDLGEYKAGSILPDILINFKSTYENGLYSYSGVVMGDITDSNQGLYFRSDGDVLSDEKKSTQFSARLDGIPLYTQETVPLSKVLSKIYERIQREQEDKNISDQDTPTRFILQTCRAMYIKLDQICRGIAREADSLSFSIEDHTVYADLSTAYLDLRKEMKVDNPLIKTLLRAPRNDEWGKQAKSMIEHMVSFQARVINAPTKVRELFLQQLDDVDYEVPHLERQTSAIEIEGMRNFYATLNNYLENQPMFDLTDLPDFRISVSKKQELVHWVINKTLSKIKDNVEKTWSVGYDEYCFVVSLGNGRLPDEIVRAYPHAFATAKKRAASKKAASKKAEAKKAEAKKSKAKKAEVKKAEEKKAEEKKAAHATRKRPNHNEREDPDKKQKTN